MNPSYRICQEGELVESWIGNVVCCVETNKRLDECPGSEQASSLRIGMLEHCISTCDLEASGGELHGYFCRTILSREEHTSGVAGELWRREFCDGELGSGRAGPE